ncbi:MAG: DUF1653 domain-containing protein [Clostridiales bacterium]|nr:DUF1653 domain-containing protein [Clostridiales bacterium]
MPRENPFRPGDRAVHFKRGLAGADALTAEPMLYLYEIVGTAEHTETGETLMVYRPLYGKGGLYARPLDMFLSATDKEKYPEAEQEYRFEKYEG